MEPGEAALTVLKEEPGTDLHWTVIWDRALKQGRIDPFTQPDARGAFLAALRELTRAGTIEKTSKGTYRLRGPA
jgi:hypothetical protein